MSQSLGCPHVHAADALRLQVVITPCVLLNGSSKLTQAISAVLEGGEGDWHIRNGVMSVAVLLISKSNDRNYMLEVLDCLLIKQDRISRESMCW